MDRQVDIKVHMEEQTWNNAQRNTEKEKLTDIKTYYKASVTKTHVLAHEKTNRSVEENRKPRNRLKYISKFDIQKSSSSNDLDKSTFLNNDKE